MPDASYLCRRRTFRARGGRPAGVYRCTGRAQGGERVLAFVYNPGACPGTSLAGTPPAVMIFVYWLGMPRNLLDRVLHDTYRMDSCPTGAEQLDAGMKVGPGADRLRTPRGLTVPLLQRRLGDVRGSADPGARRSISRRGSRPAGVRRGDWVAGELLSDDTGSERGGHRRRQLSTSLRRAHPWNLLADGWEG